MAFYVFIYKDSSIIDKIKMRLSCKSPFFLYIRSAIRCSVLGTRYSVLGEFVNRQLIRNS